MYFLGSVSSLASTPASKGSSSNGLSSAGGSLSLEAPKPASSAGCVGSFETGAATGAGAGFSPASFNTNFLSSVRLFFLRYSNFQ